MLQEPNLRQKPARDDAPAAANAPLLRDDGADAANDGTSSGLSSAVSDDTPEQNLSPLEMYALLQRQAANSDPTRIRSFSQMLGKNGLAVALTGAQGEQRLTEQRRQREEDRREAARLAEWNNTRQMFGGRMMSNGDILQAMQDYNKNLDANAEEAVKQGKIKREDVDEYKRTALRLQELKKLEQQGKLTEAQRREQEALEQSKTGQVYSRDANKNADVGAQNYRAELAQQKPEPASDTSKSLGIGEHYKGTATSAASQVDKVSLVSEQKLLSVFNDEADPETASATSKSEMAQNIQPQRNLTLIPS